MVNNCNEAVVKNLSNMLKAIFINTEGDKLFIVTPEEMKHFILPRVGDAAICMRLHLTVESITHNYDSKEILIECKVS